MQGQEGLERLIRCDSCKLAFDITRIRLLWKIVTKKKRAATKYYFVCPTCGHEYTCYYKDAKVNTLFEQGHAEEARKRMRMLKRVFDAS